jgi:hypothetical protein
LIDLADKPTYGAESMNPILVTNSKWIYVDFPDLPLPPKVKVKLSVFVILIIHILLIFFNMLVRFVIVIIIVASVIFVLIVLYIIWLIYDWWRDNKEYKKEVLSFLFHSSHYIFSNRC